MWTYAERTQSDAATRASAAAIAASAGRLHPVVRPFRVAVSTTSDERAMSWRDLAQSFAHDAAEMPIVSRLLAGQVVLALGYFGLRGALALRERTMARRTPSPVLAGLTVGVVIGCGWAALALVSRTRAAPAVTAFFTFGHALRQYFPPRRPLARAA